MQRLLMRRPNLNDLPALPMPPEEYTLRSASQDDAAGIVRLFQTAFETEEWNTQLVQEMLFDDTDIKSVSVLQFEENIVGLAAVRQMEEDNGKIGCIRRLSVSPAHRNRHFGTMIMINSLYQCKELGCSEAEISLEENCLAGIKISKNLEFVPFHLNSSDIERWGIVLANILNAANL